ncbi:MAG: hypothetical protein ACREJ2_08770, partial [Planctomycetota bacterium]
MRHTPWIVSEHVPDYSTLERMLEHPRFAGKKDEELAIALWALMTDRQLGLFHYCPPSEPFWGRDCNDPLLIWNVFGFTICHVHAHVLAMMGRAASFETRVANCRGHEGAEMFYAGRWHYFDGDIQMFHRLRPPEEKTIASREDLFRDPTLATDQPNPSNPYIFPDRPWQAVADMYKSPPEYLPVLEDRIHAMDFRLRPGEELTRYFYHRGRWFVFDSYPAMFKQYRSETGAEGPTERYWPRRQWGNGFFFYRPDLTPATRDFEQGAESARHVATTARGLVATAPQGEATFRWESPYIFCGLPDPLKQRPSADGATLEATFDLPVGGGAWIDLRPGLTLDSADAPDWQRLWTADARPGEQTAKLDFTPQTEGRFQCDLRFGLTGVGSTLRNFETRLWFMVSPHSLPALRTAGANRMRLHSGDRYGLNTRSFLEQRYITRPETLAAAVRTENLRFDPTSYSLLHPLDPHKPWALIFELRAPAAAPAA